MLAPPPDSTSTAYDTSTSPLCLGWERKLFFLLKRRTITQAVRTPPTPMKEEETHWLKEPLVSLTRHWLYFQNPSRSSGSLLVSEPLPDLVTQPQQSTVERQNTTLSTPMRAASWLERKEKLRRQRKLSLHQLRKRRHIDSEEP
eukprot:1151366-Pelagomonas_calceolata.AAC.1